MSPNKHQCVNNFFFKVVRCNFVVSGKSYMAAQNYVGIVVFRYQIVSYRCTDYFSNTNNPKEHA